MISWSVYGEQLILKQKHDISNGKATMADLLIGTGNNLRAISTICNFSMQFKVSKTCIMSTNIYFLVLVPWGSQQGETIEIFDI